jgi:hypothetical protein
MSGARPGETGIAILDHELLAEKAAALGRAGERAELALAKLRAHGGNGEEREALLKDAAAAVYAYFIQRELCGFRRHDGVIRDLVIPGQVIARLGAV